MTLFQVVLAAATGSRRGLDTNRVGALMRYLGYARSSPSPCPAHCQYTTLRPPLPSPSPSLSPSPLSLRPHVPVADRPRHHSELPSCFPTAAAADDDDGPSYRLPITGTWNANTGSVLLLVISVSTVLCCVRAASHLLDAFPARNPFYSRIIIFHGFHTYPLRTAFPFNSLLHIASSTLLLSSHANLDKSPCSAHALTWSSHRHNYDLYYLTRLHRIGSN